MEKINEVQELNLKLIEAASFNDFDGKEVAEDLRKHKDLWEGAIMGRFFYAKLIPLRDIDDGYWNVDELCILPKEGKEDELVSLAKTWNADEVDYYEPYVYELGGGKHKKVLRVWWD